MARRAAPWAGPRTRADRGEGGRRGSLVVAAEGDHLRPTTRRPPPTPRPPTHQPVSTPTHPPPTAHPQDAVSQLRAPQPHPPPSPPDGGGARGACSSSRNARFLLVSRAPCAYSLSVRVRGGGVPCAPLSVFPGARFRASRVLPVPVSPAHRVPPAPVSPAHSTRPADTQSPPYGGTDSPAPPRPSQTRAPVRPAEPGRPVGKSGLAIHWRRLASHSSCPAPQSAPRSPNPIWVRSCPVPIWLLPRTSCPRGSAGKSRRAIHRRRLVARDRRQGGAGAAHRLGEVEGLAVDALVHVHHVLRRLQARGRGGREGRRRRRQQRLNPSRQGRERVEQRLSRLGCPGASRVACAPRQRRATAPTSSVPPFFPPTRVGRRNGRRAHCILGQRRPLPPSASSLFRSTLLPSDPSTGTAPTSSAPPPRQFIVRPKHAPATVISRAFHAALQSIPRRGPNPQPTRTPLSALSPARMAGVCTI
jgi:hypothetical protein